MHMPEMWGYLQFSDIVAGAGTEPKAPDADIDKKWALRMIYYAETEYYKKYNTYASDLKLLGLGKEHFQGLQSTPVIQTTQNTFECFFPDVEEKLVWTIYHDGRILLN